MEFIEVCHIFLSSLGDEIECWNNCDICISERAHAFKRLLKIEKWCKVAESRQI